MSNTEYSHHEHHHHHHHHHHHNSSSSDDNFADEVKEYIDVTKKKKKYKDTTSKFRSRMKQRHLRKKLLEDVLMVLGYVVAGLVLLGVFYAYFIDKS